MRKYYRPLALVMAVMLIACGKKDIKVDSTSTSAVQTTKADVVSTTAAPQTTAAKKEKVRALNCIVDTSGKYYAQDVVYLRDNLVCLTYHNKKVNLFYVVDAMTDSLLHSYKYGPNDQCLGLTQDNRLILFDTIDYTIRVVSEDGKASTIYKDYCYLPSASSDGQYVYCIKDDKEVLSIDLEGNVKTLFTAGIRCDIYAYDIDKNLVSYVCEGENLTTGKDYAIASMPDNSIAYCTPFINDTYIPSSGGLFWRGHDFDDKYYVRFFGYDANLSSDYYEVSEDTNIYYDPASATCVLTDYVTTLSNDIKASGYTLLDLSTGTTYDLTPICNKDSFCTVTKIKGTSSYVVVSPGQEQEVVVIDTELYEGNKATPFSPNVSVADNHHCSDSLSKAKAKASEIEAKYGVTILIGNEILDLGDNDYYEIISGEEVNREAPNDIYISALNVIDNALATYPEGFFEVFKAFTGKGGLRFSLVDDMNSLKYDTFQAAGLTYKTNGWYNIVLDYDYVTVDTVEHEMWHAVEQRIEMEDSDAFECEAWDALNPPDFHYSSDFDNYKDNYEDNNRYILDYLLYYDNTYYDPNNVYFVEQYSTTTGNEDRATLIEYFDDFAMVKDYPALQKKLEYMKEKCVETFGYAYWEK